MPVRTRVRDWGIARRVEGGGKDPAVYPAAAPTPAGAPGRWQLRIPRRGAAMKRLPALLLSSCLLLPSSPAVAASLVRIDIVDREQGRWLPEYRARGEAWIAGTPGHRYAVRLTNTSGERQLVVLSIDGVNAITGQTADPAQPGYVLEPWQGAEINGWRKSHDDVAAFVFTSLGDSYAARTGRPDNVGTIGVAVFRERTAPRPRPSPPIARPMEKAATPPTAPAPAAADREAAYADRHAPALARQQIGTGHGAREWSPAGQTSFVRASRQPAQLTQLRYDSPQALAARGIVPRPTPGPGARRPQAFPGAFVPDPPSAY